MKYNIPAPRVILMFIIMLTTAPAMIGQEHYTTIGHGNWNDFAIWAIDGEPCYCAPPVILDHTEVSIMHEVNSFIDITIGSNSVIAIDITGTLTMPINALNVEGKLLAYGRLQTQQLDICDHGKAMFAQGAVVGTKMEVNGSLDLLFTNNDTFVVAAANVNVNHGADFDIQNGTLVIREGDIHNYGRIDLNNASIVASLGDIRNEGTIAFANACLTGIEGDLVNTGRLTGEGAINVAGSLVSDEGSLSTLAWCATEWFTDSDEPDCVGASMVCGKIGTHQTSSLHNIQIVAKQSTDGVELHWFVDGECDVKLYELQKAASNFMFFPIAWIDPTELQEYHKEYSCVDNTPAYEKAYYRIAIWESNGETKFSDIVEVGKARVELPSL